MPIIIKLASKYCYDVILSYEMNLAFSGCYEILHSVQDDNFNCQVNTSPASLFIRFLLYVWAAPASAIGCCVAAFTLCRGATLRIVDGVAEVGGGRLTPLVRMLPHALRFDAITLGHIVLGLNHTVLETHRLHEHAHVRQYERWGMLFFPLYLGSSLAQLLRGRDPHSNNHFEREASMNAASATIMPDTPNR